VSLSSESTDTAEVAIVGAGVIGVTTAYYLSKLGRRVVAIEKEMGRGRGVGEVACWPVLLG